MHKASPQEHKHLAERRHGGAEKVAERRKRQSGRAAQQRKRANGGIKTV